MLKRVLIIKSHVGVSRYYAELPETEAGYIVRQRDIPSPYASGPTHIVWSDPKRGNVIIVETSHKNYEVFSVGNIPVFATEDDCLAGVCLVAGGQAKP